MDTDSRHHLVGISGFVLVAIDRFGRPANQGNQANQVSHQFG